MRTEGTTLHDIYFVARMVEDQKSVATAIMVLYEK